MKTYYIEDIIDDLYEEAFREGAWGCGFSDDNASLVVFLIDYEGFYYWEAIWAVVKLVNERLV